MTLPTLQHLGQAFDAGWQDIGSAPKNWEPILVWAITESERDDAEDDDRQAERSVVVAVHSDIQPGLWWIAATMERVFNPTHWQPLPAPPAADVSVGAVRGLLGEQG